MSSLTKGVFPMSPHPLPSGGFQQVSDTPVRQGGHGQDMMDVTAAAVKRYVMQSVITSTPAQVSLVHGHGGGTAQRDDHIFPPCSVSLLSTAINSLGCPHTGGHWERRGLVNNRIRRGSEGANRASQLQEI